MRAMLSILTQMLSAAGSSIPFDMVSSFFHSLFQKSTEIVVCVCVCVCYTSVGIFQSELPTSQVSCTIHFLIGRFSSSLNRLLEFQSSAVISGIFFKKNY